MCVRTAKQRTMLTPRIIRSRKSGRKMINFVILLYDEGRINETFVQSTHTAVKIKKKEHHA